MQRPRDGVREEQHIQPRELGERNQARFCAGRRRLCPPSVPAQMYERARTRCDAGLMNRLFVTRRENGGGRVKLSMGVAVAVAVGAGSGSGSGDAVAVRSDTGGRWPESMAGRVQAARGAAAEVVGALR
jgi:hypothetical protein